MAIELSGMPYRQSVNTFPADYTDWCKRLRRRLRPYSAESIVDACIQILDHWRGKGLEELQSAPWLTLLIVKVVLEDDAINLRAGASCPPSVIDELRNDLWNTPSVRSGGSEPGVFLMLRSLIHTQLLLQQRESFGFVRWPALIATLPAGHDLREHFVRIFGCDPDTFIGVVYASYAAVLEGKTYINSNFFEPLRPVYGGAIDAFLNIFAKDISGLRAELRNELHNRIYEVRDGRHGLREGAAERPDAERIEFPWLSRFPILRHRSGRLAIWHRLVFARGMEDAVHNALSNLGQAYTDPFSRVFESYVVDLIRHSGLTFYGEEELKAGNPSRPAVEAVIQLADCNVLIESKMSKFPDRVLISDRGPEVFAKLRRVREGMVQGWRVGDLLRNGSVKIGNTADQSEDFLIIVTSRQLNLCSGEHLPKMFGDDVVTRINPESSFGGPSDAQLARLPLKNVFVLSIEEFEHLSGALADCSVDLQTLLKNAAQDNADPKRSSMNFDQILGRHVKRWKPSRLVREARIRVERRLRQALSAAAAQ